MVSRKERQPDMREEMGSDFSYRSDGYCQALTVQRNEKARQEIRETLDELADKQFLCFNTEPRENPFVVGYLLECGRNEERLHEIIECLKHAEKNMKSTAHTIEETMLDLGYDHCTLELPSNPLDREPEELNQTTRIYHRRLATKEPTLEIITDRNLAAMVPGVTIYHVPSTGLPRWKASLQKAYYDLGGPTPQSANRWNQIVGGTLGGLGGSLLGMAFVSLVGGPFALVAGVAALAGATTGAVAKPNFDAYHALNGDSIRDLIDMQVAHGTDERPNAALTKVYENHPDFQTHIVQY